ncbi:hypothetical protein [Sanguibacter massiliensis]|uniref:hypothetical protein n=1 Tax=Sanguibacter massiliensis TaxID=1973217 RepID=UPI000C815AF7|nr:hypothetical protein [Sanguibacter massiliensis]
MGLGLVLVAPLAVSAQAALNPNLPTKGNGRIITNLYSQGTHRDGWVGPYAGANVSGSAGTGLAWCTDASSAAAAGTGTGTTQRAPIVAYALWKYESSTSALNRAALAYLVHSELDDGGSDGGYSLNRYLKRVKADHADVVKRANDIIAEAEIYGGTDSSDVQLTMNDTTLAGQLTDIGVRASGVGGGSIAGAGAFLSGIPFTATITGNATWVANGSKTLTGTTTGSALTRNLKASAVGTVKVSISYSGLPSRNVIAYYPGNNTNVQRFVVQADPTSLSDSARDATTTQIEISSQASKTVNAAGVTTIGDTITLSEGPAGATITGIHARLWRHSTDPTARPSRGSGLASEVTKRVPTPVSITTRDLPDVKLDKNGAKTFTVPSPPTTSTPGCYTWVVWVDAQMGMDRVVHDYGTPAETVCIDKPTFAASVVTTAAFTKTATGTVHSDTIVLSDLPANATITGITAQPYLASSIPGAAVPQQSTVPATATALGESFTFSVTTDANGNARHTASGRPGPDRGVVSWVVKIPAQSAATWELDAYTSDFGIPTETVRMYPPVITTVAAVDAGAWTGVDEYTVTFTDTITLGRATPGASGPVTAELYYAGTTSPDQQATVPAGAQRVGTATGTLTANASGAATLALPVKVKNPRDGHYTFVVRTPAGVLGFTTAYVSAYGIDEETVFWEMPPANDPFSITTQVSDQVLDPGGCVHDVLDVTDQRNVLGTHPANVTVTAWGPFVARPTPGAAINPARDPKIGSTQVRITGTGPYAAPEICTDPNGPGGYVVFTYAYPRSAVYSPPFVGYDAFEDLTVYATETALVQWQPKVTTQVSDQVVEPGGELVDTFHVTGGRPGAVLDVVLTAHGPLLAEPIPSDVAPVGTPTLGTVTVRVTLDAKGEARGQTPGIKTDPEGPRGFYTWTDEIAESAETFGGKPVQAGWRSTYGVATETALVPWTPSVATRVTAPYVLAGDTFRDEIEVTGLRPQEAVEVASSIWKVRETDLPETPEAMTPELIERLGDPWAEVTTTVTADADGIARGVSPEVSTDPTGAFVYVVTETFTASTDTFGGERVRASWTGPFGVPSEIVRTVRVTTQATPHVLAGTPTTDVARVEGYVPDGSTLVFKQYDQDAGDDVALDELVWTSEPVAIDAQDTDQVAEYTSPEAPGRDPGTTYWREELHIPGVAEPIHVGAPRLPNETTTIVRVTTKAQSTVVAGTPLVDVALVEGPVPAGSRLVWQLYAQDAGEDVTLDEHVVTTEAVTVEGPGEFESPAVTYDVPGTVYWREALYLPGQETPIHVGAPRLPNETTTITPVPTPSSDGEDSPPSDGEDTPTSDGEDVPDSEGDGLPETGAFVVGSALLAALLLASGVVMRVRRRAVA